MPGLESTSNQIGRIDPSSLIGKADTVVEPRAVSALTDAFRQGVITAEDITARLGELGKSQRKAEIMTAQEATSPEAQALRAQQTSAATEQGKLAEAQALRGQILEQYPAVAYFDKLAPAAGIEAPKLPDGSPDYKQMEKIGAELALHQAEKADAATELENIVTQESQDGSVLFARTKQGEFVDPKKVAQLRAKATRPFQRQRPGEAQVSTTVDQTSIVEPRAAASQTVVAAPVVEPQTSTPAAGVSIGGGISLGPPAITPGKMQTPEERALAVEKAKSIIPPIDNAIAAVQGGGVVGPLVGSAPVKLGNRIAAAFGFREDQFKQQRDLEIAISSKILEGAQVMKGNLSDKDVRFLRDTVPNLADTPELWTDYLNRWKQMAETNARIAAGDIPKPTGDLFAPPDWEPGSAAPEASGNLLEPAAAGSASAPVKVNSPAEAPDTAQFIQAPDGRVFKNPKYQPRR